MTQEQHFRDWLRKTYGVQDYEAYQNTQTEEIAIQYAQSERERTWNDAWISVKERLPEPNVKVLVCLTYGSGRQEITFSHWNPRVECFDHFMENIITYWAPEPKPPLKP